MKKAVNLTNGVKKFVQYNSDLMPAEKLARVEALRDRYKTALHHRNRDETDALEKELISSCEGAVPNYKSSAVKENIEVIVVAIVVALGIRAYFLQPFKIPTASMQPTLNGIVAETVPEGTAFPNPVVRAFEYVARGRNYVDLKVPQDWGTVQLLSIRQRSTLHFFTVTDLVFADAGQKQRVLTGYVPAKQLVGDLWFGAKPSFLGDGYRVIGSGIEKFEVRVAPGSQVLAAGSTVARGFIDTGDQVLVNKMAYHFRRPDRGEVFVFSTAGIKGITPPEGIDSQHYIKRLTGLPGDTLQLKPQEANSGWKNYPTFELMINGQVAEEAGMQRVMGLQGKYPGYSMMNGVPQQPVGFFDENGQQKHFLQGTEAQTLASRKYMAMGDNSPMSFDSRAWGPVPEENLVGPALFVYWPFLPHWGLIR
jgi:signal peptidase I